MKPIRAEALMLEGVAHAFFTRQGGVSGGLYASFNGGLGSADDPEAVQENHARMAACLGVARGRLLIPQQVHSADVGFVTTTWAERPRCDGLVTGATGLAIGVTGADCGMILFADPQARVVAAAHAGWRGARDGIVEASVRAMEALGARRDRVVAVLGPCIAQASYDVGSDFVAHFERDDEAMSCLSAGRFDLHAYIALRAARAGIGRFVDLALDTYADEERFFSYRRSVHRQEGDYGRLVSAIALL